MRVNADLNLTAHQSSDDFIWHPSPLAGVERVLLDRVGDEVAVATSLVRYAPQAYFDAHGHVLGEEFIVLEGVFSDEHGDYPVGTYIRNPPGTAHKPHSEPGCIIFVKLRQFDDVDLTPVIKHISTQAAAGEHDLYQYKDERVGYVHIPAGERFAFGADYFVRELLILSGELSWQQEVTHKLKAWSWIRMAPGSPLRVTATTDCLIFTKTRPQYRDPGR